LLYYRFQNISPYAHGHGLLLINPCAKAGAFFFFFGGEKRIKDLVQYRPTLLLPAGTGP